MNNLKTDVFEHSFQAIIGVAVKVVGRLMLADDEGN
jgi:hypothetical protein